MARAGTRSQHQASQSQPQQPRASQSQPQRGRRGRGDEEESDEDEEDGQGDRALDEGNGIGSGGAHDELERKANDLVRLALFTETRRVPLKRDEILKKVLGSSSRAFNMVLARAQDILRKTFGMDLVELQSRASLDKDSTDHQDAELLKNTGVKKRAAPSGTKTYILRSVLDPVIIEHACAPDRDILNIEKADMTIDSDDYDDEDGVGNRSNGSILAWHYSDELGSVGVLYVILSLILVDGRVMRDSDLRAVLKRLGLTPGANVPQTSRSTHQSMTVDAYLSQLVRQGYLDRQRVGDPKGAGGKRGRAPAATQAPAGEDIANTFEWRWGPRAMSEIGEKPIAQFIAEFMVQRPTGSDDDDEDERDGQPSEEEATRKKQLEIIMKGIERAAAGSALQDLK